MKKIIFVVDYIGTDELSILQSAGYTVVVISNQSDTGKELFSEVDQMGLDLSQSWMIGDTLNDIEAGLRAGCHTIFLNSGKETEWRITEYRIPDFIAADLQEATRLILTSEQQIVITERKYVT